MYAILLNYKLEILQKMWQDECKRLHHIFRPQRRNREQKHGGNRYGIPEEYPIITQTAQKKCVVSDCKQFTVTDYTPYDASSCKELGHNQRCAPADNTIFPVRNPLARASKTISPDCSVLCTIAVSCPLKAGILGRWKRSKLVASPLAAAR